MKDKLSKEIKETQKFLALGDRTLKDFLDTPISEEQSQLFKKAMTLRELQDSLGQEAWKLYDEIAFAIHQMDNIIATEDTGYGLIRETETGDRTVRTIEEWRDFVNDRISRLRNIGFPIRKNEADRITKRINRSTENVIDIYENIDNEHTNLNRETDQGDKALIRRWCIIYFQTTKDLAKLINGKADKDGNLYLEVITYK